MRILSLASGIPAAILFVVWGSTLATAQCRGGDPPGSQFQDRGIAELKGQVYRDPCAYRHYPRTNYRNYNRQTQRPAQARRLRRHSDSR
jgi:hypothetical protein